MGPERAIVWASSALAVMAVLLIGGVHPWIQVGLSAAVLLVMVAFAVVRGSRGIRLVPFALPALVAVGWTVFQLAPLPARLVAFLSPQAFELRAGALAEAPAWMPLSLDVPATVLAALRGAACLGLVLVVGALARPLPRAHRALLPIALLGGFLVALSVFQRAVGMHESVFGLYQVKQMPGTGTIFGTLVNQNHAAALFTISALISVGLAFEVTGFRRYALGWSAVLSTVGVLMTASRSGALGLAVGGFLLMAFMFTNWVGRSRGLQLAVLASAALIAGGLWFSDGLRSRLTPLKDETALSNPKVRGMEDGARLAGHFALAGVGRGAFESPVELYRSNDDGVRLVYPENLPIQMASEWGIPVSLILLVLFGLAIRNIAPRLHRLESGTKAAACAVVAVLVHDVGDFSLEVLGIAMCAAVALGVVVGRIEEKAARDHQPPPRRMAWPVMALALSGWAALVAGGAWAAEHTIGADLDRIKAEDGDRGALIRGALARHPSSDLFELLAAQDDVRHRRANPMRHINRAMFLHPANAQTHVLAARTLVSLGHRNQAALEYRLAQDAGVTIGLDEILRTVGAGIIDAVPQRPATLLTTSAFLLSQRHSKLAEQACQRAVEASDHDVKVMIERLRVAGLTRDAKLVHAAVDELLAYHDEPRVYAAAAVALQDIGEPSAADEMLRSAAHKYPESVDLTLSMARLRLARGDATGAMVVLKQPRRGTPTLEERRQIEEMIATVAEKSGDMDGATLARLRAKLIARQLHQDETPTATQP
jgi:hypothetical protein